MAFKAMLLEVTLDLSKILLAALVGGIAGWLAGLLVRGRGYGLIGNVIIGLIGGVLGGIIINFLRVQAGINLHLPSDWIGQVIEAFIGAFALLLVVRLLLGGSRR